MAGYPPLRSDILNRQCLPCSCIFYVSIIRGETQSTARIHRRESQHTTTPKPRSERHHVECKSSQYAPLDVVKRPHFTTPSEPDDIQILQHNTKTEHPPLTNREITSNARILLAAGSDTTATNLSGATWLLLTHPHILQRAQLEVRTTFKTSQGITLRNVNDEKRVPYLNAVIREVLRFYPSVPSTFPRVTGPEGAMIDGRYVPGNVGKPSYCSILDRNYTTVKINTNTSSIPPQTTVGVHQWSTYHSKDNFALPDEFHPERWLQAEREAVFDGDVREALQPFTTGPRMCLGKKYVNHVCQSPHVRDELALAKSQFPESLSPVTSILPLVE